MRVRCLNIKSGIIKMLPENLARDRRRLQKTGWIIQDLAQDDDGAMDKAHEKYNEPIKLAVDPNIGVKKEEPTKTKDDAKPPKEEKKETKTNQIKNGTTRTIKKTRSAKGSKGKGRSKSK